MGLRKQVGISVDVSLGVCGCAFHGGDVIFLKKSSEAKIPPGDFEHLNLFSVDVLSGQERFHFLNSVLSCICAVIFDISIASSSLMNLFKTQLKGSVADILALRILVSISYKALSL